MNEESWTLRCILLGYGETTKGYRLYDLATDKVFYCREVKFNEAEKGDGKSDQPISETSPRMIILLMKNPVLFQMFPKTQNVEGQLERKGDHSIMVKSKVTSLLQKHRVHTEKLSLVPRKQNGTLL